MNIGWFEFLLASLVAMVWSDPASAADRWPSSSPADRSYYCAIDRQTAAVPVGYSMRLGAQLAARAAAGQSTSQALDEIGSATCRSRGTSSRADYYGWNWPANEPADNAFLCSDHRGTQPTGYGEHVNRAIFSRLDLGMGLTAAARDVRALGGCPLPE